MKSYGLCASELPVEIIDNISVVNSQNKIQSDFLHRAIIIIYSIGMRPDIQNPLVWFNQLIDATGNLPE